MEHITEKTKELIDTIKESDIYNKYTTYKNKVSENTALYEKVNSYKSRQLAMETRRNLGDTISRDEEQHISNMFTELSINEDVNEMFYYEEILINTIMDIFEALSTEINVDLGFFEE